MKAEKATISFVLFLPEHKSICKFWCWHAVFRTDFVGAFCRDNAETSTKLVLITTNADGNNVPLTHPSSSCKPHSIYPHDYYT